MNLFDSNNDAIKLSVKKFDSVTKSTFNYYWIARVAARHRSNKISQNHQIITKINLIETLASF